jgi:FkbM family methyltransferase
MNIFVDPVFEPTYREHPIVLVDIGARGGPKQNWLPARRHLRTIGFEPDPEEFRRLSEVGTASPSDLLLDVALHSRREPINLFVARDRGLTSCFPPNHAFLQAFPEASRFDTAARAQVAADSLDAVLLAHGTPEVDFLKIDTQGSELLVLQGASGTLGRSAVGVEVEVEFAPIYAGQPLFADVDPVLRAHGFQLFDLRPCYWKRTAGRDLGGPYGQIIWADALYFKTVEAIAAAAAREASPKSKVLRAVSIVLLYGYVDYALEIVRESTGILGPDERALIEGRLRRDGVARGLLPRFPGKRTLAAALRRVARWLTDPDGGWSVGEGKTGNLP